MTWRTLFVFGLAALCAVQLLKLGSIVFDEPRAPVEQMAESSHDKVRSY
jgi:hypothetical protein